MISGPGVVCPLEGGVSAATARQRLVAQHSYDYTTAANTIPMFRAAGLLTPAWATYRTNPAPITLIANEPNNGTPDGDGIAAATLAQRLQGVTLAWCGPNCLITSTGSGTAWESAYVAAGGIAPTVVGAHFYPFDGQGLKTAVRAYKGHLVSLGWDNLPLVLTEVGGAPSMGNYQTTHAKRVEILRAAFDLWWGGEIAGFFWFAHRMPGWSHNDLLNSNGSLTALGQEFRRLATGQAESSQRPAAFFPIARK